MPWYLQEEITKKTSIYHTLPLPEQNKAKSSLWYGPYYLDDQTLSHPNSEKIIQNCISNHELEIQRTRLMNLRPENWQSVKNYASAPIWDILDATGAHDQIVCHSKKLALTIFKNNWPNRTIRHINLYTKALPDDSLLELFLVLSSINRPPRSPISLEASCHQWLMTDSGSLFLKTFLRENHLNFITLSFNLPDLVQQSWLQKAVRKHAQTIFNKPQLNLVPPLPNL